MAAGIFLSHLQVFTPPSIFQHPFPMDVLGCFIRAILAGRLKLSVEIQLVDTHPRASADPSARMPACSNPTPCRHYPRSALSKLLCSFTACCPWVEEFEKMMMR